ncbi:MAG: cytochrome c maturation protein CcmE [Dehalococcoidia bacterium]|nr:MAG: cytochrome c maturation protein CcmE [Dehalococcoidia bacterium]
MQKKYYIGGLLIVAALASLLYTGFREGAVYYYTIGELMENSSSLMGKDIRVAGNVADTSIEWDAESLTLRFTMFDEEESLPVVYSGIVPDNFDEGREVVVGGKYDQDGIFSADSILTKCPSKYAPQE